MNEHDSWLTLAVALDKELECSPVDYTSSYARLMSDMLLDMISLFGLKSAPQHSDFSRLSPQAPVYHTMYAALHAIPTACKDILRTSFQNIYFLYNKNNAKAQLHEAIVSNVRNLRERLEEGNRAQVPVQNEQSHALVASVLEKLSDDELLDAYYVLNVPSLHPCLAQGTLIKMLLLSHGKRTFARTARARLIHALSELLLEIKDTDEAYSVSLKNNLAEFIKEIEECLELGEQASSAYYKKVLGKVSPERKGLIKDLIGLYSKVGFCQEANRSRPRK